MTQPGQPTVTESLSRFPVMVVGIVLATVVISVVVALATAPSVQASATVALATPSADAVLAPGVQGDASLARYTAQRARYMASDPVLERVAEMVDGDVTELRDTVDVTPSGTSNTVIVTASAEDAEAAVTLAQAVVEAYRAATADQVDRLTEAAIESIDTTAEEITSSLGSDPSDAASSSAGEALAQLRLRSSELLTDRAVFGDGVEFVNAARLDAVQEPAPPVRQAGLGLIVGLVLAATAAWLRADRDAGITDSEQLEAVLGAPTFGTIHRPATIGRPPLRSLDDFPSHDFRLVWSAFLRHAPKGVVVVGSSGAAWRSTAALHLAVAAARDHVEVLLVDADLGSTSISSALKDAVRPSPGLSGVLTSGASWHKAMTRVVWGEIGKLSLLQAGTHATGDLRVPTMQVEELVEEWRNAYDLVIVDAETVETSELAAVFYGASDGVLLLVDEGTDERMLERLRRSVALQGANIIGGVLASAR